MALKDNLKAAREAQIDERGKPWSQARLAIEAGVSQQLISQLESGEATRTKYLPEIAKALGVQVGDLDDVYRAPGVQALQRRTVVPAVFQPSGDLPVYASAEGGFGELMVDTNEIIDYVGRPDPLQNVKDGFAVYIIGDSMSPAFEQGDLALVHPRKPARGGDDVLISRDESEFAAVIKRLVRASNDEWHLEQFNPPRRFKLARKEWPRCYVIVGKYSRR